MMKKQPLYIGGQEVMTEETRPVYNKATKEAIAEISVAGAAECKAAVDAAEKAFQEVKLSPYERYEIILKAANLMRDRIEDFASTLSAEAGKPGLNLITCDGTFNSSSSTYSNRLVVFAVLQ